MLIVILLAALTLAGVVGTVVALVREDRGPMAPPASHRTDPRFLPPTRNDIRAV